MPFIQHDQIRYLTFDIFPPDLKQAVFTRQGGVSPAPWTSLNVGGTVGDEADRVRENRARSFATLNRTPDSLFDVWQVHSADAVYADAPRPIDKVQDKADIILTDKPAVTLYMRFADCVPILLYDPRRRVVGLAHAGWLGTVRGAASASIRAMTEHYGSKPADILAVIGPSIGKDHYEIGSDVISQIQNAFGLEAGRLIEIRDARTYFDLWTANRIQLEKSGVEKIEVSGMCTACNLDDWYSHRAEKGRTGRFGAMISLA